MAVQAALIAPEAFFSSAVAPLVFAGVAGGACVLGYLALRSRPALVAAAAVLPPVLGLGLGAEPWVEDVVEAAAPLSGEPQVPSLIVIALDGVGSDIFDRYRDRMPALSGFAEEAARGRLVPAPPYLSPAIWTSVSTGLPSEEHGVANYELYSDSEGARTVQVDGFYGDPAQALALLPVVIAWRLDWLSILPSTRLHRQGEPFWRARDGRSGLVCWPASWPAEPVDGVLITDRWPVDRTETLFHYRTDLPAQTWPPEAQEALVDLRRSSSEPPDPELLELAALTDREIEALKEAVEDDMGIPKDQPFSNLFYAWISDRSCMDAARWTRERVQPDTLAVYLSGPDLVAHAFYPTEDCAVAGFDAAESERLCPLYGDYLARLDEDLAWLLEQAGPETTTVVLSDHGMRVEATSLFGVWHEGDGFVFARGPAHEAGDDLGREPAEYWNRLLIPEE